MFGFPDALFLCRAGSQLFGTAWAQRLYPLIRVFICASALVFCKEFPKIRLGALGVLVEHLLEELVRSFPVSVLKRHIAALEQGLLICAALAFDDDCLVHRLFFLRFVGVEHLVYSADKVLDKADLAHVVAHQHCELFRHVVWVHIAVAGDEKLRLILAHHGEKTAPLVLDPHGVEVFRARADDDHDFSRVQRGKYVWLILCAGDIFKRDTREEHAPPLLGELVIDVLSKHAVARALTVFVELFIADEHVVRLGVLRSGEYAALHLCYFCRVFLVLTAGDAVGVLQCGEVVHVLKEAVEAGAVAGRQPFVCRRIFNVFDAEAAQRAAPMRLRVRVVLGDDALVHAECFVKLASAAKMVAAVERRRALIVAHLGQRHRAAAVLTGSKGLVDGYLHISAAHLAFDYCHISILPVYSFMISICFSANSNPSAINSFLVRPVSAASLSMSASIAFDMRMEITVDSPEYFLGIISNFGSAIVPLLCMNL